VGQVEAALGLHHVGELGHDVPVLLVEGELHLGLVLLEILGAHGCTPPDSGASSPSAPASSLWTRAGKPPTAARPLTNEYRCTRLGPCSASAASCTGVQ